MFKYFLHESVCCFENPCWIDDDEDEAVDVGAVFKSFNASVSDLTPD